MASGQYCVPVDGTGLPHGGSAFTRGGDAALPSWQGWLAVLGARSPSAGSASLAPPREARSHAARASVVGKVWPPCQARSVAGALCHEDTRSHAGQGLPSSARSWLPCQAPLPSREGVVDASDAAPRRAHLVFAAWKATARAQQRRVDDENARLAGGLEAAHGAAFEGPHDPSRIAGESTAIMPRTNRRLSPQAHDAQASSASRSTAQLPSIALAARQMTPPELVDPPPGAHRLGQRRREANGRMVRPDQAHRAHGPGPCRADPSGVLRQYLLDALAERSAPLRRLRRLHPPEDRRRSRRR